MSSVHLLVVEDADRCAASMVPSWFARTVMAALSADPVTLFDLRQTLGRYIRGDVPWSLDTEPATRSLVDSSAAEENADEIEGRRFVRLAIDLSQRQVFATDPELLAASGTVSLVVDGRPTATQLVFHRGTHWNVARRPLCIPAETAPIEPAPAGRWLVFREVLYDRLVEAIAETGPREMSGVRSWQRRWLLTPRDDLDGRSPRDVLLFGCRHVAQDIEDQQQNWANLATHRETAATDAMSYRCAFLGPTEVALYHRMVRHLLQRACHDSLAASAAQHRTSQLASIQASWLSTPDDRLRDQPPRALIDRERCRLPLVEPGDSLRDCDCPLCRLMAGEGPSFWFLHLPPIDREFLYSQCRTEEEWKTEQEWYDVDDGAWDADMPEWYVTTFVNPSYAEGQLYAALFRLGSAVAEVLERSSKVALPPDTCARLNPLFDAVRDHLRSEQRSLAVAALHEISTAAAVVAERERKLAPSVQGLDEAIAELTELIQGADD